MVTKVLEGFQNPSELVQELGCDIEEIRRAQKRLARLVRAFDEREGGLDLNFEGEVQQAAGWSGGATMGGRTQEGNAKEDRADGAEQGSFDEQEEEQGP